LSQQDHINQQQQQQQQQQPNITLRRSSRAKRNSPAILSAEASGSGGSESDSPRTSDPGTGQSAPAAAAHAQGHVGSASAVAWTAARDFISVGSDGVARVWDVSGAKPSAKSSFQGENPRDKGSMRDLRTGKSKVALRAVASVSEHVFATGGGDAGISMWDTRMKKAIAVLQVCLCSV
jgi:WD40 repeat protein